MSVSQFKVGLRSTYSQFSNDNGPVSDIADDDDDRSKMACSTKSQSLQQW